MKILDKLLKVVAVVSWVLTAAQLIIVAIIKLRFSIAAKASSIGIIGGADGPTAIFLSSNSAVPDNLFQICQYVAFASTAFLLVRRILRNAKNGQLHK